MEQSAEERRRRFIPTRVGNTARGVNGFVSPAVHPHACGEHFSIQLSEILGLGSSPRVWGTQPQIHVVAAFARFIPTRVGNTLQVGGRQLQKTVHPHACGEHVSLRPNVSILYGSSPRVWGTPPRNRFSPAQERFIPTRVGNTDCSAIKRRFRAVHPHACGEHAVIEDKASGTGGSSPRVWGTHAKNTPRNMRTRFIPTRVGNTMGFYPFRQPDDGSSPRVWGTLRDLQITGQELRFIPTRVGNTLSTAAPDSPCAVHPHACGEHTPKLASCTMESGSSPRVWGTRAGTARRLCGVRFIPTRVGNTPCQVPQPIPTPVHPHACGEHELMEWGPEGVKRFIPTRVGNT